MLLPPLYLNPAKISILRLSKSKAPVVSLGSTTRYSLPATHYFF